LACCLLSSIDVAEWVDQLECRSKRFAIAAVRFARELEAARQVPRSVIWQFIDCSTAVAANHRSVRRARSKRELASKLSVVVEEADETVFWLELIEGISDQSIKGLSSLQEEAVELRAIFAAGAATARKSAQLEHGHAVPIRRREGH
jgi:four helix bundle protein